MATAELNPILTSISGTAGKLVFYKRHGTTIMRAWIMPPNPRTQAQQSNRGRFKQAMTSWQALSIEEKASYNARAKKIGLTGHNLFISRFMKRQVADNTGTWPVPNGVTRTVYTTSRVSCEVQVTASEQSNSCVPPLGDSGSDRFMKQQSADICMQGNAYLTSSPFSTMEKGAGGMRSSSSHPLHRSVTAPSMQGIMDYARGFTVD
jgi:hypothetical protein